MAKRKRSSSVGTAIASLASIPGDAGQVALARRSPDGGGRASTRKSTQPRSANIDPNPDTNPRVVDGWEAVRASPDAESSNEDIEVERTSSRKVTTTAAPPRPTKRGEAALSESSLSELSYAEEPPSIAGFAEPTPAKRKPNSKPAETVDPEADEEEDANPEEISAALQRPPPVNSSYLPLPWKGRLGYACLCTYLRSSNPPVFSSRTCRIASILEHRHPLKDPSQPEHATKNRPDKSLPADIARGQAYVEALGLANARDIPRMLRWNHKFGIKFLRLSSEMFPFASHDVYGYKLAPFASEALADAGKVAAELGHRLTTHPGQFTQLGSPREEVIAASIKDLEYHCELLSLLRLPPQQDRDAVMILHMGGVFGDKAATLDRFRKNYAALSQPIKDRLVLENDDVCYSVHDLLPICKELNIPFVLDYHHNNIIFDADKIREGTRDIVDLYDRITATWTRKGITQKMHYSEPTPGAITARQRRKHNPRVSTLPPCPPNMDLMIEAKDKEQAVFELMRTFKLPGFDTFNDILPYQRTDENKPWKAQKKTPKKKRAQETEEMKLEVEYVSPPVIPAEEVGMGGSEGRVYWPPGMEEWLRPKKKEVKKRDQAALVTTAQKAAARRAEKAKWQADTEAAAAAAAAAAVADGSSVRQKTMPVKVEGGLHVPEAPMLKGATATATRAGKSVSGTRQPKLNKAARGETMANGVPTPSTTDADAEIDLDKDESEQTPDLTGRNDVAIPIVKKTTATARRRQSSRAAKRAVLYVDEMDEDEDDV